MAPSEAHADPTDRDARLDAILGAYYEAVARDDEPDRLAWIARHPEFAAELAAYFVAQDDLHHLSGPLRAAAASHPGTGPRVLGDYELLEEIARGGMGVVYKARQVSLGRVVALKLILAGEFADPAEVRRFRAEAEAVALLDHPNIVPIYEVGSSHGRHFFSMKLFEGGSLADHLDRFVTDPRAAASLVATVARAVHHAHRRGILHRDLKPSNVLLDADGRPHVVDFGLAKRVETDGELTQSGALLGSPSYMAPEQTTGRRGAVTTATDVYGLGALLYTLLTGRPPFRADSAWGTIERVQGQAPEPPSGINRSVGRDLQTICLKCLEKEPARRYATAEELAGDLDRFLAGRPILARRPGMLDRLAKWARRNQGLVAGALLVLVLAVLGLSLAVLLLGRERARTARERDFARGRTIEARDAAETLRRELYVSRVRQAHGEWLASNVAQAEQILESCPADLRGWEWFFCKRLCHLDALTLRGHTQPVESLAFDRDGKRLLSSSRDIDAGVAPGEVGIWDATAGRAASLGAWAQVSSVAYSPTGGLGAVGHPDGHVTIVDASTGRPIRRFRATDGEWQIAGLAFSGDGRRIAAATGVTSVGAIELCDVATGRHLITFRGHARMAWGVAFHPGGERIASASEDGTVRLWDASTGEEVRAWRGHNGPVYGVAFDADGSRIASAGWDRAVRVWDAASAADAPALTLIGHNGFVRSVAFSPDGARIASAGDDHTVRVWDARTGLEIAVLRGHADGVRAVAFDPGGTRLASGADDATIKLWDLDADHHARVMRHADWVRSVAYSPDGRRLLSASSDGTLKLWDARTGREIRTFRGHRQAVHRVAVSPDGHSLASVGWDRTVRIWDLDRDSPVRTIDDHTGILLSLAFRPDGARVASAGEDGPVRVRDVRDGHELGALDDGAPGAYAVAYSPDGTRVAAAGNDETIRIWDAGTGRVLVRLGCPGSTSSQKSGILAFSPDGRRVAATVEVGPGVPRTHEVRVWDATTGRAILALRGHTKQVNAIAFSPDGTRIASAGNDGTVKLWEAATGREVFTLRGHTGGIIGLAFSPDGQHLATGSVDAMVRIWDAPRAEASTPAIPTPPPTPARKEANGPAD